MDNFEDVCYNIYGLDPCYYFTAPSLSWDAMLKYCNQTIKDFGIELLTDMDMYLLFEKSIRGGLSQIAKGMLKQIINIHQIMTLMIYLRLFYI